jgi:chitodextrinase
MAQKRLPQFILLTLLMLGAGTARAQTTATSIQLTWTAPGDDGNVGTATQYDLRYSTSTINASNFASATQWNATPTPTAAGTSQTVTVTGLTPSTLYYFAIKTADNAGNWSAISNVISKSTLAAPDVVAPGAISVNVTTVTDTTATLSWAATGDDSVTGTANNYDVRYSTSPITPSNWNGAAQSTGEPTPAAPGTVQTFVVRSLARDRTYYFAIRAADEIGNLSVLSNVPSATTTDTMPPSAILNLTANFMWLAWYPTSAVRPRGIGDR